MLPQGSSGERPWRNAWRALFGESRQPLVAESGCDFWSQGLVLSLWVLQEGGCLSLLNSPLESSHQNPPLEGMGHACVSVSASRKYGRALRQSSRAWSSAHRRPSRCGDGASIRAAFKHRRGRFLRRTGQRLSAMVRLLGPRPPGSARWTRRSSPSLALGSGDPS